MEASKKIDTFAFEMSRGENHLHPIMQLLLIYLFRFKYNGYTIQNLEDTFSHDTIKDKLLKEVGIYPKTDPSQIGKMLNFQNSMAFSVTKPSHQPVYDYVKKGTSFNNINLDEFFYNELSELRTKSPKLGNLTRPREKEKKANFKYGYLKDYHDEIRDYCIGRCKELFKDKITESERRQYKTNIYQKSEIKQDLNVLTRISNSQQETIEKLSRTNQMLIQELIGLKQERQSKETLETPDLIELNSRIQEIENLLNESPEIINQKEKIIGELDKKLSTKDERLNATSNVLKAKAKEWLDKKEYKVAISVLEAYCESIEDENEAKGEAYFMIGETSELNLDYFRARINFEKAVIQSPENSKYISALARILDTLGKYDKAIEYYEQSLAIKIKALGKDHPSVATSYNNIGSAWDSKMNYDKAISYFEQALDIAIPTLGKEHPHVVTININLIRVKNKKG